jgi:hypothetical protein
MAGTFPSIYGCEGSPHNPRTCATYRTCLARGLWGKSDRSATRPAEHFLTKENHWAVRCRATVIFIKHRVDHVYNLEQWG